MAITPELEKTVDRLWREWFPGFGDKCRWFAHGDKEFPVGTDRTVEYEAEAVCSVSRIPPDYKCGRLIVSKDGKDANRMLAANVFNGVNWQRTAWGGNVGDGITETNKQYVHGDSMIWSYPPIIGDWLAVTVDLYS